MEIGQGVRSISAAQLDYRFGWRWLLPYVSGQSLYLGGFGKAEKAFWLETVSSSVWVQEPMQAEGWIIDTDGSTPGEVEKMITALPYAVQWVVCSGTGKAVHRLQRQLACEFAAIREYGLVPAAKPRLVIPLAKSCHAVTALALHRPGRWTARLGIWLAAMLARCRLYFPLRRRVLLVATRAPSPRPIGALRAGCGVHLAGVGSDFALYLGTPDENRKTVALPLKEAAPDMLIKMGESTQARQALRNEAASLAFLANYSLARQVPQVVELVENEHCVALYQEYRPRLYARPAEMEEAVIDFLVRLSTIEPSGRPLQEVLAAMPATSDILGLDGGGESAILSIWWWLQKRAEDGAMVYEHRSHGDFAPWNCAWTAHGLFVYDWEESRPQSLAFGDAFYYALAPALHVDGKQKPSYIQARALSLAGQVARRGVVMTAEVKVHFALWLLGKQATHPAYALFMEHLAGELSV